MDRPALPGPRALAQAGFTLVEALLALALLGACLIPAAYALRDSVRAPADNVTAAHNLDCVTSLMETVLAKPYDVLYGMAKPNGAVAFPDVDDANCPQRQVTITSYGIDSSRKLGPGGTSAFLLYVSVSLKNASDGNPYTLTTLVAR
jgi:prepilin-type N-terminal cleavage/methylation domain-containing protein